MPQINPSLKRKSVRLVPKLVQAVTPLIGRQTRLHNKDKIEKSLMQVVEAMAK